MRASFGPWTTAASAGSKTHLSSFWKLRLAMLPAVHRSSPRLGKQIVLFLTLAAGLVWAMPTLRGVAGQESATAQEKPLVIAGVCRDAQKRPIADARVALYLQDFKAESQERLQSVETDPGGRFRFKPVPSIPSYRQGKQYAVVATTKGKATACIPEIPGPRQTPDQLELSLSDGASLRGRVTGPQGEPIEGAEVWVPLGLRTPVEGLCSARSDAQGDFAISDLKECETGKLLLLPGRPGEATILGPYNVYIRHPRFGWTTATFASVPGTVNVTLQRPAVIEGRVVNGETEEPVPGVKVQARGVTSPAWPHVATDSQGRYRMGSLGGNRYNIWAEKEGWTVRAVAGLEVAAGETKTAPDLRLVRGTLVVGRVIDVDTGRPIRPTEDERLASEFYPPAVVLAYGPSRPRDGAAHELVDVDRDGSFRIRVASGTNCLYLRMPEGWKIVSPPPQNVERDIADGQEVEIHFRVKKEPAGPKKEAATPASPSPSDDKAKPEPGSAESLERLYALRDGEVLKREPPPFSPSRLVYYRERNPTQAQYIPEAPGVMLFRFREGRLKNWGLSGTAHLPWIVRALADVYPQEIEGDAKLVRTEIEGDWIVREGTPVEKFIGPVAEILRNDCKLAIRLALREVDREVIVANGDYRFTPLPGHRQVEIYGVTLLTDGTGGGSSGDFEQFLAWVGMFIGRRVVSGVQRPPKAVLSWHYNSSLPFAGWRDKADSDESIVLKHLTEQTGLNFTKEKTSGSGPVRRKG